MVLRLSPDHPLVWRSPSSVQFGVHDPVAVLASVPPVVQVLIELLLRGVAEPVLRAAATARGVSGAEVDALLHALRFALEPPGGADGPGVAGRSSAAPDAGHRPPPVVALDGRGPAAGALADLLARAGWRVLPGDDAEVDDVRPTAAVIVSHFATVPRRAAVWLRADVPHLLVEFGDRSVRVGPVVVPGESPCAACLELRRLDADPAWLAIAAQVAGRTAPSADPAGCALAAAVAARVLAEFGAGGSGLRWQRRALVLARAGAPGPILSEVKLRRHPGCACRSPTGNAREHGRPHGAPRPPPTTGRGARVPG